MNLEQQLRELTVNNPGLRISEIDEGFMVEQCICKDEYGVPLFKGDKYWFIRKSSIGLQDLEPLTNTHCIIAELGYIDTSFFMIFKTEESANKWIKENEPRKPTYVDPDNEDEFFEEDTVWYFFFDDFELNKDEINALWGDGVFRKNDERSKYYKTREKCEIALCSYIAKKHDLAVYKVKDFRPYPTDIKIKQDE